MSVSYTCKSCENLIRENENSLQCDLYETWIHCKCKHLNFIDYKKLQSHSEPWYCFCCNCTIFPFRKLNHKQVYKFLLHENNMDHSTTVKKNIESLILNPPQNLSLLFNHFNS